MIRDVTACLEPGEAWNQVANPTAGSLTRERGHPGQRAALKNENSAPQGDQKKLPSRASKALGNTHLWVPVNKSSWSGVDGQMTTKVYFSSNPPDWTHAALIYQISFPGYVNIYI